MKAIYSCKLYKASKRKDKIRAAIADPLNTELVTQLRSYLDDDFQDELEEAESKIKKAEFYKSWEVVATQHKAVKRV